MNESMRWTIGTALGRAKSAGLPCHVQVGPMIHIGRVLETDDQGLVLDLGTRGLVVIRLTSVDSVQVGPDVIEEKKQ